MKSIKTTPIAPHELRLFLKRANECFQLAEIAYSKSYWLGTCINAVHAGIAFADCLCIFKKGLRYSGSSHDEAIEYYNSLRLPDEEFQKSMRNFGRLISIKHHTEYTGIPISASEAESTMKALKRFKDYILNHIPVKS